MDLEKLVMMLNMSKTNSSSTQIDELRIFIGKNISFTLSILNNISLSRKSWNARD